MFTKHVKNMQALELSPAWLEIKYVGMFPFFFPEDKYTLYMDLPSYSFSNSTVLLYCYLENISVIGKKKQTS